MHHPARDSVPATGSRPIIAGAAGIALAAMVACAGPEPRVVDLAFDGVPLVADEQGRWFMVDTGSPRTLLDPEVAGLGGDAFADQVVDSWHLAGLATDSTPVVVMDLSFLDARGGRVRMPFGGIVGADLLTREDTVTFDWRGERLAFNAAHEVVPAAGGVPAAGHAVAFELRGPGGTCIEERCLTYPATRIVIPVTVEGVETHAVVDTGATFTLIHSALEGRLPERADRPVLDQAGTRFTRAAGLAMGTVLVTNAALVVASDDLVFAKLQVETNRPVEVILGYSALERHVTSVAYGGGTLQLYPYADPASELDRWFITLDVALVAATECFEVVSVVERSGAEAAGLVAGDCLVEVQGRTPGTSTVGELMNEIRSLPPGAPVAAELSRGGQRTAVSLTVIDRLPTMDL